MALQLYCPLCGTLMETHGGKWYCPKGQMHMSKICQDAFKVALQEAESRKEDEMPNETSKMSLSPTFSLGA